MNVALLSAVVVIAISLAIPGVAERFGFDVLRRFLEKGAPYDAASLRAWVRANPAAARAYAIPVLLPLDIVYLAALATFTYTASRELAFRVATGSWVPLLCLLAPLLYFVTDLTEDLLLVRMLTSPESITDRLVSATRAVTGAKLATASVAVLQVFVLALVNLFR